jgi:hypothetical protein
MGFNASTRPRPPANRVVAVLLPDRATSTTLAVLDLAFTTARRHRWGVTVIADWSHVLQSGSAGSILRARARSSGVPDLETESLTPKGLLSPIESLDAAMVVLGSPPRHRADTETRRALQPLLRSSGAATTYIPLP